MGLQMFLIPFFFLKCQVGGEILGNDYLNLITRRRETNRIEED